MRSQMFALAVLVGTAISPLFAQSAKAATLDRTCSIGSSGSTCIFSFRALAAGVISVSTRACVAGQRWRVIVARVNSSEVVSQVGTGSVVAFSGRAVRSVAKGARFLVIVSPESPVRADVSGVVIVRFAGPFAAVLGPRPGNAGALPIGGPALLACDRDSSSTTAVVAVPTAPTIPSTSTVLPPTGTLLPPTTTLGVGNTGF